MHEHKECEHKLKYCKKCAVVYCTLCGREWHETLQVTTGTTTKPIPPYFYADGNGDNIVFCSRHDSQNNTTEIDRGNAGKKSP